MYCTVLPLLDAEAGAGTGGPDAGISYSEGGAEGSAQKEEGAMSSSRQMAQMAREMVHISIPGRLGLWGGRRARRRGS